MLLGYEVVGSGIGKVVVLHDWFCDHSSYAPMRPYLDKEKFQYAFLDLRGYGLSSHLEGTYTIEECTVDVLDTVRSLGWDGFSLVCYSMTGLVGQNITAEAAEQVQRLIAICPTPPEGMGGLDASFVEFMQAAATADDSKAAELAHSLTNNRYGQTWSDFKVRRWRETSNMNARLGYLAMFLNTNIVEKLKAKKISNPVTVICTAEDIEGLRKKAVQASFESCFSNLEVLELISAGHSPMQEIPVALATTIDKTLSK